MDTINYETDRVRKEVVPFFIHFSEKGIVPKILRTDDRTTTHEIIRREHIDGVPLASILCFLGYKGNELKKLTEIFDENYLSRNSRPEVLTSIYGQLGSFVGYVSKCNVCHNDLHTENVVIEKEGRPYIIDWGEATLFSDKNPNEDSEVLLADTRLELRDKKFEKTNQMLEKTYSENFRKEILKPLDVTIKGIK
jgi:tRNA A-37 threonylcarbamoyl transferase component Bud32